MELKDLVGRHILTGCDFTTTNRDAQVCRFTLDDVHYAAEEDEDDGYRSSLDEIRQSNDPSDAPVNTFQPQPVLATINDDGEIVTFVDEATGKPVLVIGTDHADDLYPCFVANFTPENMACNATT